MVTKKVKPFLILIELMKSLFHIKMKFCFYFQSETNNQFVLLSNA
jgi:hypothetical protein